MSACMCVYLELWDHCLYLLQEMKIENHVLLRHFIRFFVVCMDFPTPFSCCILFGTFVKQVV